jgi:hypothetical protein
MGYVIFMALMSTWCPHQLLQVLHERARLKENITEIGRTNTSSDTIFVLDLYHHVFNGNTTSHKFDYLE